MSDGALAIAFKTDQDTGLTVGMGCSSGLHCTASQTVSLPAGDWREVKIPLRCYAEKLDLSVIDGSLVFTAPKGADIGLADIRIVNNSSAPVECRS